MPEPIDDHVELASLSKEERLARMRHSAAHVLAESMVELIPEAELGIGPPVDNGFYYDFKLPRPLVEEELKTLQKRMRKSVGRKLPFKMESITRAEGEATWTGQPFKLDMLSELEEGSITQCTHGDFTDLCRGGHVNHTGEIPFFKLSSIAGAYWRGDEKNDQLTRVYGLLFETKEELEEYERQQEEARRRDHRRIGRDMNLFALYEDIGPGHVIWLPDGATVRRELQRWIEDEEVARGYQHVITPVVAKKDLYVTSGHWDHYQEDMYPPMADESEEYVLRPMNCPHHIEIFAQGLHSYRELPLRIAEFGNMHRWEKSGELTGMSRVRIMTLNDAHIFCTGPEQVEQEVENVLRFMEDAYGVLGLKKYKYRLSLGEAGSDKFVDNPPMWEKGEALLRRVLDRVGLEYTESPGDAAFYGPKIDVQFATAAGKDETLVTVQVDFHLPNQFDLEFIGEDGERHQPIIVHRGVISTLERMVALLIEEYEGNFPVWLAPTQAVLIPIADRHVPYCEEVAANMRAAGLRVQVDDRGDRMNAKIRHHQQMKVPYQLIVGDREEEQRAVAVRVRGGEDLGAIGVDEFFDRLRQERDTRALVPNVFPESS